MQRVRDLVTFSLTQNVYIKLLLSDLRAQRTHQKRWQKESKNQRKWKTPRKQGLLNQLYLHTYELIENEAACTRPTQVYTRWGPRAQNQSPIDKKMQMIIQFPSREFPRKTNYS